MPSETPRDADRRQFSHRLESVANGATVIGTLLSVVSLIDGGVSFRAGAIVAFAIAVLAAVVLLVKFRDRSFRLPLWTLSLFVLAPIGLIGVIVWLVLRPESGNSDVLPSPGPSSAAPSTTPTVPTSSPPTPAPVTSSAAAVGCVDLKTAAKVEPGKTEAGVQLTKASYTLTAASKMKLQWSGKIQGSPDAGNVLYLVGTALSNTFDSEGNKGTPNYLIIQQVTPDADGCWSVPVRQIAYDCAGGITFRYYLTMLPKADADRLVQRQRDNLWISENGFDPVEFENEPLKLLQRFDVETTAARC